MLTPGASAAILSTHGWTMFRMIPNDDTQGTVGANYIIKVLKLPKVAVIDDSTQYGHGVALVVVDKLKASGVAVTNMESRSEEHTSELQSRLHLVCRLLLAKKKDSH